MLPMTARLRMRHANRPDPQVRLHTLYVATVTVRPSLAAAGGTDWPGVTAPGSTSSPAASHRAVLRWPGLTSARLPVIGTRQTRGFGFVGQ